MKIAGAEALKHALELIKELNPKRALGLRWHFALTLSESVRHHGHSNNEQAAEYRQRASSHSATQALRVPSFLAKGKKVSASMTDAAA
jgi:hypothetical protein